MHLADYDAVLRLWQKTEGIGLNESDERRAIRRHLRRNPGMSFVARKGGKIVGAVLSGHDGRRGYLHHLAVEKAHRKNGLGRKLVEACLAGLRREGIFKCNIFLYTSNTAGEKFWKHIGWSKRADLVMMQTSLKNIRRRGS